MTEALATVDPLDVNHALSSSEEWTAVQNRFEKLRREGALPAHVKSSGQAMAIARFGYSFGWDEMRSLRSVYIVKGNPTLKTEAMVALVREKLPQAEIQIRVSTDAECTVAARRGPTLDWNVYTFTIAMAKRAGLLNNPTWKSYPEVMLRWRALSQACRVEFPDATNGAYSREEMQDAEWLERSGSVHQRANYLPPELTGADQRPAIEAENVTDAEPAEPGSIGEQVELGTSPLVETCELCGKTPHDFECPHWTEAD